MKTTKPFSTISYNTNDFLIAKLNKFTENGVLKFWAFINHFPEEDEEKEHTHLYIEPESKMDTLQLANEFIEFIPGDPRPLRWMPQRPSKWDTWYLYDIHDKDYLASIGQSRKYHYDPGLIFTSDKIYLNELVGHIDYTRYTNLGSMILAARNGVTMDDFIASRPVKPVHFKTIQAIWAQYYKVPDPSELDRNGRLTHSPKK